MGENTTLIAENFHDKDEYLAYILYQAISTFTTDIPFVL